MLSRVLVPLSCCAARLSCLLNPVPICKGNKQLTFRDLITAVANRQPAASLHAVCAVTARSASGVAQPAIELQYGYSNALLPVLA
jgi:hypothetical protein